MGKLLFTVMLFTCTTAGVQAEEDWISLFNGENLDGWTLKVAGHELGEIPGKLVRVENGLMTVSYDAFEEFGKRFGHIFTDTAYSNYRFRVEYRFIGEQAAKAPGWAFRNSGIMIHCQDPATMDLHQNFPNCVEFQFLGAAAEGGKPRFSGSLFTPGSTVEYQGERTGKSVRSEIPARPLDEWVQAEAVVKDGKIQHFINGQLAMEYTNPQLDDGTPMTSGYIALQAESHPVQFRKIEILPLD